MEDRVGIILPNYNSEKYLFKAINSVINQTYKNWKLIIVDDHSNINTINKLKKFQNHKKIKIIYLKKNMGQGYCRNLALTKIKYKFIAFIDSDDVWHKDKLKKQLNFMQKKKYQFTYTNYKTKNTITKKIKKIITPKYFNFKLFTLNTSIATSTMIVKNNGIKKIKFLNTPICEDYIYKCLLLKKFKKAFCYSKFLTTYSIRNNSLQSNKFKNLFWMWKLNKNYNKFNLLKNLYSIFFISLNSLKKYGFK